MILRFLSYFNHRLYMSIYTYILKLWKMNISGKPRYIGISTWFDDFDMITLGNRVVISDNCYFLTHDYSITTVMIAMGLEVPHDIAINKGIILGDNVFIGKNSMILPGTEIGNNVIIGAMSVVRGKIKDNSIIIRNPAVQIGKVTDQYQKWKHYLESNNNIRIDKVFI